MSERTPCRGPDGALIRVLVADDHASFRSGLRSLLATAPDIEVAGEAATGDEAILLAGTTQPTSC